MGEQILSSSNVSLEFILENKILVKEPLIPGVYFLIYNSKIVYVGCSKDIHNRIKIHRSNLRCKFSHYYFLEFPTFAIAKMEEILFIKKFTPRYNILDNPIADKERDLAIGILSKQGIRAHPKLNHVEVIEVLENNGYKSELKIIS